MGCECHGRARLAPLLLCCLQPLANCGPAGKCDQDYCQHKFPLDTAPLCTRNLGHKGCVGNMTGGSCRCASPPLCTRTRGGSLTFCAPAYGCYVPVIAAGIPNSAKPGEVIRRESNVATADGASVRLASAAMGWGVASNDDSITNLIKTQACHMPQPPILSTHPITDPDTEGWFGLRKSEIPSCCACLKAQSIT